MSTTARVSTRTSSSFSALQRAEIAEICSVERPAVARRRSFSALQRAEIAEMRSGTCGVGMPALFQCSSTSRNC